MSLTVCFCWMFYFLSLSNLPTFSDRLPHPGLFHLCPFISASPVCLVSVLPALCSFQLPSVTFLLFFFPGFSPYDVFCSFVFLGVCTCLCVCQPDRAHAGSFENKWPSLHLCALLCSAFGSSNLWPLHTDGHRGMHALSGAAQMSECSCVLKVILPKLH